MKQRSQEWFKARVGRITGSIAGAALGLCPWRKPEDVLRAMVREYHGAPSEFTGNIATDYGNRHEREAMLAFMAKTDLLVSELGFMAYDDWLGASPDGITDDNHTLEIKVPFKFRNDKEPVFQSLDDQPHYKAQCMIEMLCAGTKHHYFYQYRPAIGDIFDHDYVPPADRLEIVELSQEWLDECIPKLKEFHNRYLSEIDNKEHLEPLRVSVFSDSSLSILNRIDELDVSISAATEERKQLLDTLIKESGEKNALIHGRKLTKVERKGSVQYQKIIDKELPGYDTEPFRGKGSVSWRLT